MNDEATPALSGGRLLLKRWLARRRAAAVGLHFLSAIALLVLALVALVITFFFTYAIVWFGFNAGVGSISELLFGRWQRIPHGTILIICWCFLALLFLTHARVNRDYWTSWSISKSPWNSLWLTGDLLGSFVSLLVNADASAKTITDILLVGPRLVGASLRAFHGTLLLLRADLHDCTDALAVLTGRTSSVSAAELSSGARHSDPQEILAQLLALDTVLLLRSDPPRVTLDPELRNHLQLLLGITPSAKSEDRSPPRSAPVSTFDPAPYQVFGLSASASLDEVRAAYRKKLKECHPDLFATRSNEVRQQAEEKTKAIIAAYEEILAHYRAAREEDVAS